MLCKELCCLQIILVGMLLVKLQCCCNIDVVVIQPVTLKKTLLVNWPQIKWLNPVLWVFICL